MGLYDSKGLEEIKYKLEGFLDSYKTKTGQDFHPDDLKSLIEELYRDKIKQHIKLAFETETMPTIALMRMKWDELIGDINPEPEVEPVKEQELVAIASMTKRGRKPKNATV